MFCWNPAPRVDKVAELLKNGNPTLIEILGQDSISSSIRNASNQILFDFLTREENMEELLKWALTDEYESKERYAKYANAAVTILSGSKPFQQIILTNKTFKDKLNEFTKSKPPSSRSCGHYLRIIESISNGTKGSILTELPDLSDFLINHITNMALKDLFVLMSTEFTQSFGFSTELLIKFVSTINDENCLFVVSAIREISNNNDLKKTYFDSEELIDQLFKSATERAESKPLLATELFRLLNLFKELNSYSSVLQKYSETFEYKNNISLAFQVQIFGKLTPPLFDDFFKPETCSLLVEAIYNSFINKKEEKSELIKSNNLCQKIIENVSNLKSNTRIADLAEIIHNEFPEENQEFNSFYEKDIVEYLKTRESKYGGKVKNSSDDDDEDMDEEELDHSDDESEDDDEENDESSSSDENNFDKAQKIHNHVSDSDSLEEEENEVDNQQGSKEENQEENVHENQEENVHENQEENVHENKEENVQENKEENVHENQEENVHENQEENVHENQEENVQENQEENVHENQEENVQENQEENVQENQEEKVQKNQEDQE